MIAATHWDDGRPCCNDEWERAYRRFASPESEIRKLGRRLIVAGACSWDRNYVVVDLFCGAGYGLHALERLGFSRLVGVDLSLQLLADYVGPARICVGDCRKLQLADGSCDAVVVQGGLHHLPTLPLDLHAVMAEVRRVLRPGGRLVLVEPWDTPFLRLVHRVCASPMARRLWSKVDALATMIDNERSTYFDWLAQAGSNLTVIQAYFESERMIVAFGKLLYVGRPKASCTPAPPTRRA